MRLAFAVLGAALGGAAPASARGGFVMSELGDQDFHDRQSPVPVWQIRLLGQGEPPPFDGTVFGDDRTPGDMGQFQYLHQFDLEGKAPMEARLRVGLIDHDSPQSDRRGTVALYFDGLSQPVDAFVGISSRSSTGSAHVVNVDVPPELLLDGELLVGFETVHPARQFSGNSLQIDFSRLRIKTSDDELPPPGPTPNPVPLPAGGVAGGLLLLGCALRRLVRRWRA